MSAPFNGPSSSLVADAERVRTSAVKAGRWFSYYLIGFGVASAIWIVLLDSVFPEGFSRALTAGAWAVFVALANVWAERHAVFPAGATRLLYIATAAWFLLYLLVVGPVVRWQFDTALWPWTVGALIASAPFFIAAAWLRVRG
jgi:hypothetical protein